MIVSHKYKFIYLKAHRVAGTSVQSELEKVCGEGDLVFGSKSGKQHMPPWAVKNLVGDDVWKSYLKVVNVRNPWDMIVSVYFFTHEWTTRQGVMAPALFDDFVRWHVSAGIPKNKDFWLIGGRPWADVYLRYENISEYAERLWSRLGLQWRGLQRFGSEYRPRDLHYSLMYSQASMEMVRSAYSQEIEHFGYRFEHPYAGGNVVRWRFR